MISDPKAEGSDVWGTAHALAQAIAKAGSRPRDLRNAVDRCDHGRIARSARRVFGRSRRHVRSEARHRRDVAQSGARDRHGLCKSEHAITGARERDEVDQRAALSVAQRHHGRQEKDDRGADARRCGRGRDNRHGRRSHRIDRPGNARRTRQRRSFRSPPTPSPAPEKSSTSCAKGSSSDARRPRFHRTRPGPAAARVLRDRNESQGTGDGARRHRARARSRQKTRPARRSNSKPTRSTRFTWPKIPISTVS